MTSHPAGATAFIQGRPARPGKILADPELRATLDLGRAVALMLLAVLHFLTDADDARGIAAEAGRCAPGQLPGSHALHGGL